MNAMAVQGFCSPGSLPEIFPMVCTAEPLSRQGSQHPLGQISEIKLRAGAVPIAEHHQTRWHRQHTSLTHSHVPEQQLRDAALTEKGKGRPTDHHCCLFARQGSSSGAIPTGTSPAGAERFANIWMLKGRRRKNEGAQKEGKRWSSFPSEGLKTGGKKNPAVLSSPSRNLACSSHSNGSNNPRTFPLVMTSPLGTNKSVSYK
ncbi:uncharacterized protein LOC123376693 [Mauremys mutica]|uniref:uncharacterized protein LOC123376693 n=1 Tax=Mauremys mutica TaxID=74926 RepID=UPI001D16CF0C|nr:uncharacterized protein LOC123376693 [Mauremys mutica]